MFDREIASADWQAFFDQVSGALQGKVIKIEVDKLNLGAQIEAQNLSLNGLSYDPRDDVFTISTDEIEHMIHSPQRVFINESDGGVDSLMIQPADGGEEIIQFTEPLGLPSPD